MPDDRLRQPQYSNHAKAYPNQYLRNSAGDNCFGRLLDWFIHRYPHAVATKFGRPCERQGSAFYCVFWSCNTAVLGRSRPSKTAAKSRDRAVGRDHLRRFRRMEPAFLTTAHRRHSRFSNQRARNHSGDSRLPSQPSSLAVVHPETRCRKTATGITHFTSTIPSCEPYCRVEQRMSNLRCKYPNRAAWKTNHWWGIARRGV
jgi:hypothetical protein